MAGTVLLDKRPTGVALITFNRPDRLNAQNEELFDDLCPVVEEVAADPAVRCVVVTGAGRAFSAGGDLSFLRSWQYEGESLGAGGNLPEHERTVARIRDWERRTSYLFYTMPKPTIAMVNGPAMGSGFGMALACDLRIASDQARFGTAFKNVGLPGDFGVPYFLPRIVGSGRARELMLLGTTVDAATALAIGLVNRVVPHERLEPETMALAEELAAGPTLAFAKMKENMNLGEGVRDLLPVLHQEALYQRLSGFTRDYREGVNAFLEKRKPLFTGT